MIPCFYKLPVFRWFLRKKQSKGYGVHSPFAFDLITNAIHSSCSFYAFSDIREIIMRQKLDPKAITRFNRLSFRLVHHFKATNILEINSGTGINTLFLTASSSQIRCRCVETDGAKIAVAKRLMNQTGRVCEILSSLSHCGGMRYDALFVNLEDGSVPGINDLTGMSHHDTFWVFHGIKRGAGKQFWDKIVLEERVRKTFDLRDTGIVFLRPDFSREYYFV